MKFLANLISALTLWAIIIVCATFLTGCLTLPSRASIVAEKTKGADGAEKYRVAIHQKGDATQTGAIRYRGEGPTPAEFEINGEAKVDTATRVAPLVEGAGEALSKLPDTLGPLLGLLSKVQNEPDGTPGGALRQRLEATIIDLIMGRIAGGLGEVL